MISASSTLHLYEVPRIGKLTETGSETEVTGVRGGRNGDLLLYWSRVSVWDDDTILQVDSGVGYMTLRTHLIPLSCTLKNA